MQENKNVTTQSNVHGSASKIPFNIPIRDTANQSDLNVAYMFEVLPGDEFTIELTGLIRQTNPSIAPVMDNAEIEFFPFFVPNRLVWENYEDFRTGGASPSAWVKPNQLQIPQYTYDTVNKLGSLEDHFGLPITESSGKEDHDFLSVSALPFRAYYMIWNYYFRDENLQEELPEETGDGVTINYEIQKACKKHDLFTSCLPSSQKGLPVELSLAEKAPLKGDLVIPEMLLQTTINGRPAGLYSEMLYTGQNTGVQRHDQYGSQSYFEHKDIPDSTYNPSPVHSEHNIEHLGGPAMINFNTPETPIDMQYEKVYADLTNVSAFTVNAIRLAFQTQMLLEALARGGSRMAEYLKYVWNVECADARLQKPEYITGGKATPLGMQAVTNQSGMYKDQYPLGIQGGLGITRAPNLMECKKGFSEDGMLIILYCIRNFNSYAQSLDKKWTKKSTLEFYNPYFANLGEMPLKKKEVAYIPNGDNEATFGFNEAWYEYRHFRSEVKGLFRPNINQNLRHWLYVDNYEQSPTLNEEFIKSDKAPIQNTLTFLEEERAETPTYLLDLNLHGSITRKMPVHSIPGRIDHA